MIGWGWKFPLPHGRTDARDDEEDGDGGPSGSDADEIGGYGAAADENCPHNTFSAIIMAVMIFIACSGCLLSTSDDEIGKMTVSLMREVRTHPWLPCQNISTLIVTKKIGQTSIF